MSITAPTARPGIGWTVFQDVIDAFNRTTATTAEGTVVVMAFDNEDGAVADNNEDGGSDSGFGNVVAISDTYASSADGTKIQAGGIFGVSLGIYTDNSEGRFRLRGTPNVICDGSTGSHAIAKGDPLIVDGATAGKLVEVDAAVIGQTYKIAGHALAATTSATGLIAVVFNGVEGLGSWFVQT